MANEQPAPAPQTPQERRAAAWAAFLKKATPAARNILLGRQRASQASRPRDEGAEAFEELRRQMTPQARAAADNVAARELPPTEVVQESAALYYLVECPDGEWSTVRGFKSAADLAARIGELEGEDIGVWAFYGVMLPLSKGPQRYVAMPDGVRAIQVPMYSGAPTKIVEASTLGDLEPQDDGYLGPVELAKPDPAPQKPVKAKVGGKKRRNDGDETSSAAH